MFGLESLSLAPVFRPVIAVASSSNSTTVKSASASATLWVRPAKKVEVYASAVSEAAQTSKSQVVNRAYPSKSSSASSPVVVPQSTFFGPLTTRVGTVIFGNVTKRLYHRYWCTTRNW